MGLPVHIAAVPVVTGVLLGLFLGFSRLGWPDFLAHFGPLGLMFMAGFDVDLGATRRTWRHSAGIGLASFLEPFAGVAATCRWLLDCDGPTSLLAGIGLSTTSLALVYQFLRERDLLATDGAQTILGAATAVDVASMSALAVLFGDLGCGTLAFLVSVTAVFGVLPRAMLRVLRRYRRSAVEFELRFLLLVLVALGFVAEHVGGHAARPARAELDHAATASVALWLTPALGHVVGGLFNYRLTFGIITAAVGLESGLIGPRLFSALLLIVLVSAVVPMIMLRDLPSELDR